ncbi:MAG: tyrosine-type recombinase/integrase, partial [Candidatus Dormibacteria bacterium]
MLPEPVNAPAAERRPDLLAGYLAYLAATGRGASRLALGAARTFFRRWPDPQDWAATPLSERLAASAPTRPLLTFLMLQTHLHPGYDYLVARKLPALWREMPHSPLAPDLARFTAAAAELGFSERHRSGAGSPVMARLLIQTGRRLDELTGEDLDELAGACAARPGAPAPTCGTTAARSTP